MEPGDPAFHAAVVAVHVLEMDRLGTDTFPGAEVHGFMKQSPSLRKGGIHVCSIRAEHGIRVYGRTKKPINDLYVEGWQDVIRRLSATVPRHQDADMFLGPSALRSLATALSRLSVQVTAPFLRFQEEGLVRLDHAMQGRGACSR